MVNFGGRLGKRRRDGNFRILQSRGRRGIIFVNWAERQRLGMRAMQELNPPGHGASVLSAINSVIYESGMYSAASLLSGLGGRGLSSCSIYI